MIDRRTLLAILSAGHVGVPLRVIAQQDQIPVIGFLNSASREQWRLVLALAPPTGAQPPPANLPVVGYLRLTPAALSPDVLIEHLARRGLVDGQSIRLVQRHAGGSVELLPALAQAMVSEGPAVIVAISVQATRAVQAATTTIPIVATFDFSEKLVTNLARPEGNMTGVSTLFVEIEAKKLEILQQLLPGTKHVGVLSEDGIRASVRAQNLAAAAAHLGIMLTTREVATAADLEPAFEGFRAAGATAVLINNSSRLTSITKSRLGALTAAHRLPLMCEWRYMVAEGCLASYGTTLAEFYGIFAEQVDRVLKGAKVAELPIQQPTRFELVINLKTAKALGLTVPTMMHGLADEVIE